MCVRRDEETDLERCLECNWLQDLDRAAGTPAVRCAAVDPTRDVRSSERFDEHID